MTATPFAVSPAQSVTSCLAVAHLRSPHSCPSGALTTVMHECHMRNACERPGSTGEGLGRAALQGLKGSLQQQALLCIHGLSLRLGGAEEGVIKQLHVIHEAPKALVGRKGLVPANVCLPPVVSMALAELPSGRQRQLPFHTPSALWSSASHSGILHPGTWRTPATAATAFLACHHGLPS